MILSSKSELSLASASKNLFIHNTSSLAFQVVIEDIKQFQIIL